MLASGPSILPSAVRSENKVQQDKTLEADSISEADVLPVSETFKPRKSQSDIPLKAKAFSWLREQVPLMEAFFVAVSIHVALFPTMWFIGWALPWPKPPVVTVIFEYDLQQWMKNPSAPPKRIVDIRDPLKNP